jgi:hypothetical protein
MSDAVFMAGPILAATGKLTGERKYFDAAVTHFASMRKLCLRSDGLYRRRPRRCDGPALRDRTVGVGLAKNDGSPVPGERAGEGRGGRDGGTR